VIPINCRANHNQLGCPSPASGGYRGETALLLRARKYKGIRRQIAWLTIAALMWSSGQGAVLAAGLQMAGVDASNLWHCLMLNGNRLVQTANDDAMAVDTAMEHSASSDSSVPMGDATGYCPVCSLTGCSAPSVVAQTEFHYSPPDQRAGDGLSLAHAAPHAAAIYGAARARAPPLTV